jgi:hypothetical protein
MHLKRAVLTAIGERWGERFIQRVRKKSGVYES